MEEASFFGVLRTVAVALMVWWAIKAVLRIVKAINKPAVHPPRKGEMRIERIDEREHAHVPRPDQVEEVDFEEVDQTDF